MRGLVNRCSDWVLAHPVLWGVGAALVLVLVGFALGLPPIVVLAAGAVLGASNVIHARRRGYCPLPADPAEEPSERVESARGRQVPSTIPARFSRLASMAGRQSSPSRVAARNQSGDRDRS